VLDTAEPSAMGGTEGYNYYIHERTKNNNNSNSSYALEPPAEIPTVKYLSQVIFGVCSLGKSTLVELLCVCVTVRLNVDMIGFSC